MLCVTIPYSFNEGQAAICRQMISLTVECCNSILGPMREEDTHLIGVMDIAGWRHDRGSRRKVVNLPSELWILLVKNCPQLWNGQVIKGCMGESLPESARNMTPVEEALDAANECMAHEFFDNGLLMAGHVKLILKSLLKFLRQPHTLPNTIGQFCAGQYMRLFHSPKPDFDMIRVCLYGEQLVKARQFDPLPLELHPPGPPQPQPTHFAFLVYCDGRMFARRECDGMEYFSIANKSRPDFMQIQGEPARMIRVAPISFDYLWPGKISSQVIEKRRCLGYDYYSPKYPGGIRWVWVDEAEFVESYPNSLKKFLHPSDIQIDSETQCPICLDNITAASMTPCGHIFCRACMGRWDDVASVCPVCRQALDRTNIMVDADSWLELPAARYGTMVRKSSGEQSAPVLKKMLDALYEWQYGALADRNWLPTVTLENGETNEKLITWSHLPTQAQRCLVTLDREKAKQLKVVYREAQIMGDLSDLRTCRLVVVRTETD